MTHDIFRAPNFGYQIEAKIYLGRNIPTDATEEDKAVSIRELTNFLSESVAPQFPGFTVTSVDGFWKGEREQTAVISILLEDTNANRTGVRWVAERYKSLFKQEAVAISFHPVQFTLDVWPFGPNVKDYRQSPKTGDVPA